jgi:MFS family permease
MAFFGRGLVRVIARSRQSLSTFNSALHNPDIRRIESAWALAIGAEWAHFVALGVFAYSHGGTAFVGLAGLVRLLPAGALAPFASSLGDRLPRERLLLFLLLLEAAALCASGAAALAGGRLAVLLLAAVIGITSTLVRPAVQSILPSLARTPSELIASNGASSTFEGLGALGGPLVVGATIVFVGAAGVFIASGVTLLAACVTLSRVRVPGQADLAGTNPGALPRPDRPGWTRGLRAGVAGLDRVARDRRLRLLISLAGVQCFVRGCLNVLLVVAAFHILDAGSSGVGYLNAALGIGGLLGALGAATLSNRRLAISFGLAITFWGAPIALLAPLSSLAPAMLCLVVVGGANAVEDVGLVTMLQRSCPPEFLTSVLGVLWGLAMTSVAIGSIVVPMVEVALGTRLTLLTVGLILPALALLSRRPLSRIDATLLPVEGLDLVAGVPMFAPLSVAVKERLAASLDPLSVLAGQAVVRSGEYGDRFYIVRSGTLVIERDGARVAGAQAGDYFGEVALLHDVRRTATVRAETPSTLYALGREAFVAAITGHPAASAEAYRVAAERRPGGKLPS